jgi:hypothetical protein
MVGSAFAQVLKMSETPETPYEWSDATRATCA